MIRNRLERVVFDYDSFKLFVDTVRNEAEHEPPGASRARLSYRDIPPDQHRIIGVTGVIGFCITLKHRFAGKTVCTNYWTKCYDA